jgi:hypothetical protein
VGKYNGRNHLGDPDVDRRIILKCIFRKWDGVVDLFEVAQDRDRLWALVNAVMNLRFSKNAVYFLTD